MKIEGWFFSLGAAFFLVVTAAYWFLSYDVVGMIMLLFTALLSLIAGFYVLYTSKAVYPRPEDRRDGNIDEADPEYGFFSPHSWWPLVAGFAAFTSILGLIFAAWMFAFGVILILFAASGWLFEYYYGDHAH